jgi:hypothetical protein
MVRDWCYAAVGAFIVQHSQVLIALWDKRESKSTCGTAQIVEYRRRGLPVEFRPVDSPVGLDEIGPVHIIVTPRKSSPTAPDGALGPYEILPPSAWGDQPHPNPAWQAVVDKWKGDQSVSSLKTKHPLMYNTLLGINAVEKHLAKLEARMHKLHRPTKGQSGPSRLETQRHHIHLTNIDRFNRHASKIAPGASELGTSTEDLIGPPESDQGKRCRTLLDPATLYGIDRYAVADALARRYQSIQKASLLGLCVLAVLAAGIFHWYAHISNNPYLLMGYPIVLIVAFLLYVRAKRGNFQQQYLDYRALAEGMRVAFAWQTVGLTECVSDHYLQQQRSELDWIRFALRNWRLAARRRFGWNKTRPITRDHYEMVCVLWVFSQAMYHSNAARVRRDYRKLYKLAVLVFFLGGIVLAAALGLQGMCRHERGGHEMHDLQIVVIAFATTIAAAIAAYSEKMAIAAESHHFARMIDLFMHAGLQLANLDKAVDIEQMNELLLAIGKEALDENALWVVLHRERAHEVLVG